jgi:hypothetical protein
MWFLGLSSNKAIISYHFHENSPTESLNHLKKMWRPVGSSPVWPSGMPSLPGGDFTHPAGWGPPVVTVCLLLYKHHENIHSL